MTIKPILFSGPMVRAILNGRKTQTRRVVNPQPRSAPIREIDGQWNDCGGFEDRESLGVVRIDVRPIAKLFNIDDLLWVRENYRFVRAVNGLKPSKVSQSYHCNHMHYEADHMPAKNAYGILRPSIFMPRWASRLTLKVTDVRVQRLREISESDANLEGVEDLSYERYDEKDFSVCFECGGTRLVNGIGGCGGVMFDVDCTDCDTYKKRFKHLWNSLNAKRGYAWSENPWVVAYTFEVIHQNIDAYLSRATSLPISTPHRLGAM